MYLLLISYIFTIYSVYGQIRIPPNPCENIFSYKQNQGIYYGEVRLPYNGGNRLDFAVNVSMIGIYQDLNLEIDLLTDTKNLRIGTQLLYKINFPLQNVLPKISEIQFNKRVYCSGPPEPLDTRGVTSLWASLTNHLAITGSIPTRLPFNEYETFLTRPVTQKTEPPVYPNFPTYPSTPPTKPSFLTNPAFLNVFTRPRTTPTTTTTTTTMRSTITRTTPRPPPPPPQRIPSNFPVRDSTRVCGKTNDVQMLILNGEDVKENEVPWLVAMFAYENKELKFKCTCNLVSDQHIVTAAHCVRNRDKDSIFFILGKSDLTRWAVTGGIRRTAAEVIIHPKAREKSSDGDVAVIKLNEPVTFTDSVLPICLWNDDTDFNRFVNSEGIVAGWGIDEEGILSLPRPKKVKLPIVAADECLWSNAAFKDLTSNITFCAGRRNGAGPCRGDSGGGFIVKLDDDKYYLRGVVSYALAENSKTVCNLKEYAVFADTAKLVNWIKDAMK